MKVLFVFGSHVSYEVFQDSGFLLTADQFKEDVSLSIALRENHKTKSPETKDPSKQEIPTYRFESDSSQEKYFYKMLDFYMIRKRKHSRAFREKLKRRFLGKYKLRSMGVKKYIPYLIVRFRRRDNALLLLAGIPIISNLVFRKLKKRYPYPNELLRLSKTLEPDLIVLITNGAEPSLYEVPLVAKKLKTPWHLIIDNWDNLSSKSVFWEKPDHIYVWGPQHADFAQTIHGIERSKVSNIGTPRITFPKNLPAAVGERTPFLVYVGQQEPYDELSDLRELALICDSQELKLIYRPHPLKHMSNKDKEEISKLIVGKKLILNISENFRQLQDNWATTLKVEIDYLNLNKQQLLNSNVLCVIGPPTSLILESLIYGNPTIVMARDDKMHRTTASMYWNNYPHFGALRENPSVRVARNHQDLVVHLQQCISEEVLPIGVQEAIQYICGEGSERWSLNLIESFLASSEIKRKS